MMDLVEAIARLSKNGRIRSAWLLGMRIVRPDGDTPGRITEGAESGVWREADGWWCSAAKNGPFDDLSPLGCEPDPTDPATAGCLLALLREAYRSPTAHVVPQAPDEWIVWVSVDDGGWENVASGRTEVEAVVGALVAAAEEA